MIRAGLGFGALGFLAGGVLGPLREWLLAPRLGGMVAALLEAVVMVLLLWLAARAPHGLAEQAPGVALLFWLAALPFLVRR